MIENTIPISDELRKKLYSAQGDFSKLSDDERMIYYEAVCESIGMNPLTRPFEWLVLNNKLRLYALRDCADQLRKLHGISIHIVNRERVNEVYIVTARARDRTGREDESTGAVPIGNLKGEALANALMKAECVPLTSEILTRNGFRFYDELTIGEEVLAYDVEQDRCVWTPLREVTVYEAAPIMNFGTKLHTFQCTPDHSWPVHKEGYQPDTRGGGTRGPRGAYRSRTPDRFLCQAMSINTGHRVVLSALAEAGHHPLTPTEAAILGWVMCDGSIKRAAGSVRLGICQSKPERVKEIQELLRGSGLRHRRFDGKPSRRIFPSGRDYDCLPQTWFYLPAPESRTLLMKANLSSPADFPALVTQLSYEARQAMLAAMMAADGDARGVFGKKRKPGVMEAWQILATLEGYALGKLGLSSAGDVPLQRLRKQRYLAGNNLERSPAGLSGVWCPTTDYGTWVMRQHGMVTITGNTKSKRRVTLSIAGLGWIDEVEVESSPSGLTSVMSDPMVASSGPALGDHSPAPHDETAALIKRITSLLMRHTKGHPKAREVRKHLVRQAFATETWAEVEGLSVPELEAGLENLMAVINGEAPDESSIESSAALGASEHHDLMSDATQTVKSREDVATGPPGALATDQQIHELKMRAGESGNEALYADIQDAVDLYQGALPLEIFESLATRLTSS